MIDLTQKGVELVLPTEKKYKSVSFTSGKKYAILKKITCFQGINNEKGGNYMNVNESAENYLETILILSHRLPVVRSVDIANE